MTPKQCPSVYTAKKRTVAYSKSILQKDPEKSKQSQPLCRLTVQREC